MNIPSDYLTRNIPSSHLTRNLTRNIPLTRNIASDYHKRNSLWPSLKKYSISEYIILLPISQEIPLDRLSRNIFSTQPKSCGGGSWYKPWQSGFWSSGTGTSSAWCGERERTPHTPHLAPPNRQHSPDFINISSLPHSPSPQDVHTSAPLLYQNPNLLVYIFIYILHHRSIPTRLLQWNRSIKVS